MFFHEIYKCFARKYNFSIILFKTKGIFHKKTLNAEKNCLTFPKLILR